MRKYIFYTVIILIIVIAIWGLYLIINVIINVQKWDAWTGLQGRTAWDFVQLIIIPGALALIAIILDQTQRRIQRKITKEQTQEKALQSYLDTMTELLMNKDLRNPKENAKMRSIIQARTQTVLRELDPTRKGIILYFLYRSNLVCIEDKVTGGEKPDPQETILYEASLQEVNLKRGNLKKTDLRGVNLQGANLEEVDLQEAVLCDANLQEANLKRANLKKADLRGVNLQGVNLEEVDLQEAILCDIDLQEVNLQRANLKKADLQGIDLQGANLDGADLQEANLFKANLRGCKLERAVLQMADLRNTNLQEANFREANLQSAKLENSDLLLADLFRAELKNAILQNAELRATDLQNADLKGGDLQGALLQGSLTNFDKLNLLIANSFRYFFPGQFQRGLKLDRVVTRLLRGLPEVRWLEEWKYQSAKRLDAFLQNCTYDNTTRWPSGFDPKKTGAINKGDVLALSATKDDNKQRT